MEKINWTYADKYGELPSGQAEQVEALVEIAEQINKLNGTLYEIFLLLNSKP